MASCLFDIIKYHSLDFIGIQETIKKDLFMPVILGKWILMSYFAWEWISSVGRSGGILCDVKKEKIEAISWSKEGFILQVNIFNVEKKLVWGLLTVYGAAQEENKVEFLG